MKIDVAFLDSGTGGIPYMLELKKKSPHIRCAYLGDTANFPYGEKSNKEVTECASKVIRRIIEKWHPKTIVIACNTISVTALDELRKRFPSTPIVGTVPAIKLAAKVTSNKKIGLLATNATVKHPYSVHLIEEFASDCQVYSRGDPKLISFIEHDLFTATKEQRLAAVEPAVSFFKSKGCDTIILGCTHFTHISDTIEEAAGSEIKVVDSRNGVANHTLEVTESQKESEFNQNEPIPDDMSFFVTGFKSEKDEKEYSTLCKKYNIPWCGLL